MILQIVYLANILVAGWIGVNSLFYPNSAAASVFSGVYHPHPTIRLVGALWMAIAICSLIGLFRPIAFSPILVLQFIYKFLWLVVVAIPALSTGQNFPKPMAVFFLIWVLVLPWVIPWKSWWELVP